MLSLSNLGKETWKLPYIFQAIVRQEVLTRIVLLVLKHISDSDLAEKLPGILSLFREVASRSTALEVLEIMLRYVVHAKQFDEKDIGQIIRKASVGDEIMETFIEKYIQQGKTEGILQGKLDAGIGLFLKMMAARFGKVPRSVKKKVESADLDTIENWSIRLLHAQTLEEVMKN